MKTRHSRAVVLVFCSILLSGCSIIAPNCEQIAERMSDDEILDMLRHERLFDVRWNGATECTLHDDGWSGPSSHCEVYLNTDHPDAAIFDLALLQNYTGRLFQKPRLLFPLLESNNPEDVLAALCCYRQAGLPISSPTAAETRPPKEEMLLFAEQFRRLLREVRDVRVRFLAAKFLRTTKYFDIEDIDRMLSDSDLAVQCEGVLATYETINMMQRTPHASKTYIGSAKSIYGGDSAAVKKLLMEVMLKHLEAHHFYIRGTSYHNIISLITRKVPGSRPGTYTTERPDTFPPRFDWARESWQIRQDQKKILEGWWGKNGKEVLTDYGPDRTPAK